MSSDGVIGGGGSFEAAIDTSWLTSSPSKTRRGRSTKHRTRRYTLSPSIGNNNVMSGVNWNDPEAFPIIHQDENCRSKAGRGFLASPKTELAVFRDGPGSSAPSNSQDADLPDPKDIARLLAPETKDSPSPRPRVLVSIANREPSPIGSRGVPRNQKRTKAMGRENRVDSHQDENLEPNRVKPVVFGDGKQGAHSQAVGATIIPEKISTATSQYRDEVGGNAEPQPQFQHVPKRKSRNSRRRSIVMPSEAQPLVDSELGSDSISPPASGTGNGATSEASTKRSTGDHVTEKYVEGASKGNVVGKDCKINDVQTAARAFPLSSVNATSCLMTPLAVQRGWKARPGESSRSLVRAYHAAPADSQRARRIAARLFCLTGYCLLPVTPEDARVLCRAAGDSFDWGLDEGEGPRLVSHPQRRKTREQKRELVMQIKPIFALMDKAAKDEKLAVETATGIVARKGSFEKYCYEDRETGESVDFSVYKAKYDEHVKSVAASRLREHRSLRGEPLLSPSLSGNPTKAGNLVASVYDPNIGSSTVNSLGESSSTKNGRDVADAVNEPKAEHVPEPVRPSFRVRRSLLSEAHEAKVPTTFGESAPPKGMDQSRKERAEHADEVVVGAPAGEPLSTSAGIDRQERLGRVEYSENYEGRPDGPLNNMDTAEVGEGSSSNVRGDVCVHSAALDTASIEVPPSNAPIYLEPSATVGGKPFAPSSAGVDNSNHVQCELASKEYVEAGKVLHQGASLVLKDNNEGLYEITATPKQSEHFGVASGDDTEKLPRHGSATPRGGSAVSTDELGRVAMSVPYLSPVVFPVKTHHVADVKKVDANSRSLRSSVKLAGGIEEVKSCSGSNSPFGKRDGPMAGDTVGDFAWANCEDLKECDALEQRLWAKWDDALAEYRAGIALLKSKRLQRASTSATFGKEGEVLQKSPVCPVATSVSAEAVTGNGREAAKTTISAAPSSGREGPKTSEGPSGSIGHIPTSPPLLSVSADNTLAVPHSPVLALRDLRLVEEAEEEKIASPCRSRRHADLKFLRAKNKARRRTLAFTFSQFQAGDGNDLEEGGKARGSSIMVGDGDESRKMCKLCCKRKCNTIFRPCEHMLCSVCARKVVNAAEQSGEKLSCPWDRQLVNGICSL